MSNNQRVPYAVGSQDFPISLDNLETKDGIIASKKFNADAASTIFTLRMDGQYFNAIMHNMQAGTIELFFGSGVTNVADLMFSPEANPKTLHTGKIYASLITLRVSPSSDSSATGSIHFLVM